VGPCTYVPSRNAGIIMAQRLDSVDARATEAVELGQALEQPWTLADARALPPGRRVGRKKAHMWLSDLRHQHSHQGKIMREAFDMTFDKAYDWQGYVANHPDCENIVGPGILHFEFRFVNAMEQNKVGVHGDLPVYRADFIAHRADGTAVRLHPSVAKEAQIITGNLQQWRLSATPGPPPDVAEQQRAPAAARGMPPAWRGHNQADKMSAAFAYNWLQKYSDDWRERSHPRGQFYLPVTTMEAERPFPWWLLCIGETWGQQFCDTGVDRWAACWLTRREEPAFHVILQDGVEYTVRLVCKGSASLGVRVHIEPGSDDVSYN